MGCEDSEWALAHGLPPGGLLRLESRTGSPAGFSRNVVTDLAGAKGKARSSLRILIGLLALVSALEADPAATSKLAQSISD